MSDQKTTPQIEDGFTKIANAIADNLCRTNLSAYQSRVVWAIFRKTYSWHKKEDFISISQLVKLTGIHKAHVSRAKKELIDRRIVTERGNKIGFQKNSDLWLELPKGVTSHHVLKVTEGGNTVTEGGNKKLPKGADTKEKKETIQKKIISKDITRHAFGNRDVNQLIAHMKVKFSLPVLDESEKTNRQYANLCIRKFGGAEKVQLLIEAAAKHQFWSTKITSFKTLYYKGVNIISSGRDNRLAVTKI